MHVWNKASLVFSLLLTIANAKNSTRTTTLCLKEKQPDFRGRNWHAQPTLDDYRLPGTLTLKPFFSNDFDPFYEHLVNYSQSCFEIGNVGKFNMENAGEKLNSKDAGQHQICTKDCGSGSTPGRLVGTFKGTFNFKFATREYPQDPESHKIDYYFPVEIGVGKTGHDGNGDINYWLYSDKCTKLSGFCRNHNKYCLQCYVDVADPQSKAQFVIMVDSNAEANGFDMRVDDYIPFPPDN